MIDCSCKGVGCKLCARSNADVYIIIPVEPMGAVRTTQRQKFVDPRAQRYADYKEDLKYHASFSIKEPKQGPVKIKEILFHMPIPKNGKTSYKDPLTGKRQQIKVNQGDDHTKKPDIDNLIKGLFDSLNGVVWVDDAQVCEITNVKKVYSGNVGIEVKIQS